MHKEIIYTQLAQIPHYSLSPKQAQSSGKVIFDFLPIFITIIGWGTVFLLNQRLQKRQLQYNAKIKIYEELQELKKDIDEISIKIGTLLNLLSILFLEMRWAENPSNQAGPKITPFEHWQRHISQSNEQSSNFTFAYLKFLNHTDTWMGAMPELKKAKGILFFELRELGKKLSNYEDYLRSIPLKNYDWKTWDQEEIIKRTQEIDNEYNSVAIGYLEDFIGLVHNSLVSPIFGYRKLPRENFVNLEKLESYKILTIDGLVEIKNK